jgi:hypothetical protein
MVAGAAIERWTDREPNDAGEVEREEFETALADWGEESLGKVEAPAWIVLLLALVFLVASKYVGAARRPPKPEPAAKPIPAKPPTPPPASVVATPGQGAVTDATVGETVPTVPTILDFPDGEKGDGNAQDAEIGF